MLLHSLYPAWICFLLAVGVAFGLVFALADCGKRAVAELHPREMFVRGDRVVVELAAAKFFEGRVLGVEPERLRVQASGGNDPLSVSINDVYRLPPAAHEVTPNMLAICGEAEEVWQPCRVLALSGTSVSASNAAGSTSTVTRDRVLVPSALTELNLKRYFARSEAERAFARSAERAGDPRTEPGWHPSIHERLLVKRGAEWFTGYVRALNDDSVEIALASDAANSTVPRTDLAPEPPSSFAAELKRGDFVLIRPEAPSGPWLRWQVRALNDKELRLSDARGVIKSVPARDVVPLAP